MRLTKLAEKTIFEALPVLLMVLLIPFVSNDLTLTLIFSVVIIASFYVKLGKGDLTLFFSGLALMTLFEAIFVSTGVETFTRKSLFGMMPLWLPLIWGYGFVVIKRFVVMLKLADF